MIGKKIISLLLSSTVIFSGVCPVVLSYDDYVRNSELNVNTENEAIEPRIEENDRLHLEPLVNYGYENKSDSQNDKVITIEPKIIEISTEEDLESLSKNMLADPEYTLNATVELMNDIDLRGKEWIPLGNNKDYSIEMNSLEMTKYSFKGIFDGNGHTISNFHIFESYICTGFFAAAENAIIKDVTFDNVVYTISYKIADNKGDMETNIIAPPVCAGTVTGYGYNVDLFNVNVNSLITIKSDYTEVGSDGGVSLNSYYGGLVGYCFGNITDCSMSGLLKTETNSKVYAGGIAGTVFSEEGYEEVSVSNCTNNALIDIVTVSYQTTGGIIGNTYCFPEDKNYNVYVDECVNNGCVNSVTYQDEANRATINNGGIVGVAVYGEINNCDNYATDMYCESEGIHNYGGIAGYSCSNIINCKVIDTDFSEYDGLSYFGGLVGRIIDNESKVFIKNNEVSGIVYYGDVSYDSNSYTGGAAGYIENSDISNTIVNDVEMEIESSAKSYYTYLAGICGAIKNSSIDNCEFSASINTLISENNGFCGGITGRNINTTINECNLNSIELNLQALSTKNCYQGGISAYSDINSDITGCVVTESNINADTEAINSIYSGGFVGYANGNIYNSNLINSSVISKSSGAGALYSSGGAAILNGELNTCQVEGSTISSIGKGYIYNSGCVATNAGKIESCNVKNSILNYVSTYIPSTTTTIVYTFNGGICAKNISSIANSSFDGEINGGSYMDSSGNESIQNTAICSGGIVGQNGINTTALNPASNDQEEICIENCVFNADNNSIINVKSKNGVLFGGITANNVSFGNIYDCSAILNDSMIINSDFRMNFGGIAGRITNGNIKRCKTEGKIVFDSVTDYIGGISGQAGMDPLYQSGSINPIYNGSVIEDCHSSVYVRGEGGTVYVGGICGYVNPDTGIEAEKYQPTVKNCYFEGNIEASSDTLSIIGGCVGYIIDSQMQNCYALGSVKLTMLANESIPLGYAGGCIGRIKEASTVVQNVDNPLANIKNCFSNTEVILDGEVSASTKGIFTGQVSDNGNQKPEILVTPKIENCYYISETADEEYENIINLTKIQAADEENYNEWDFDKQWYIENGILHLMFEKTGVYYGDYNYTNGVDVDHINSLMLSKVKANSYFYVSVYDTYVNGVKPSVFIYDISDDSDFKKIDCDLDIPAFATVKTFIWNKDMIPLADNSTIIQ